MIDPLRFMTTAASTAVALFCGAVTAQEISIEDLEDLPSADIVILGEVHDNPEHHIVQAEAIFALRPPAVVFEMLSDTKARAVRPDMMRDAAALEATLDWNASGWPDFSMYYPVFLASEGALLYGAAAPRDEVKQATTDGAALVFGAGASLFALDRSLDDREQTDRNERQRIAHCDAMPLHMLYGMVEAQRLRDAYLARATLAAFYETGGPVVLVTGNGHARHDWGVPAMLKVAAPDLRVFSLGQFEAPPSEPIPFDRWIVTDPAPRKNPCDAFE